MANDDEKYLDDLLNSLNSGASDESFDFSDEMNEIDELNKAEGRRIQSIKDEPDISDIKDINDFMSKAGDIYDSEDDEEDISEVDDAMDMLLEEAANSLAQIEEEKVDGMADDMPDDMPEISDISDFSSIMDAIEVAPENNDTYRKVPDEIESESVADSNDDAMSEDEIQALLNGAGSNSSDDDAMSEDEIQALLNGVGSNISDDGSDSLDNNFEDDNDNSALMELLNGFDDLSEDDTSSDSLGDSLGDSLSDSLDDSLNNDTSDNAPFSGKETLSQDEISNLLASFNDSNDSDEKAEDDLSDLDDILALDDVNVGDISDADLDDLDGKLSGLGFGADSALLDAIDKEYDESAQSLLYNNDEEEELSPKEAKKAAKKKAKEEKKAAKEKAKQEKKAKAGKKDKPEKKATAEKEEKEADSNEELIDSIYGDVDSLDEVRITGDVDGIPDLDGISDLDGIRDLDDDDDDEEEEAPKPKKEKKKKEPKPKKEKKKKEPKPKKPKAKPKPSDFVKVTPFTFVKIIIFTVVVVVGSSVGSKFLSYNVSMTQSKTAYRHGKYDQAYDKIAGLELKEKDMDYYHGLRAIMSEYVHYYSYNNYRGLGMNVDALKSLLDAYSSYNKNYEYAVTYEVIDEYDGVYDKVLGEMSKWGISAEAAEFYLNMENEAQFNDILKDIGGKME